MSLRGLSLCRGTVGSLAGLIHRNSQPNVPLGGDERKSGRGVRIVDFTATPSNL